MEQLWALAGCDRPWAAQRAAFLIAINEAVDRGEVTQSEYQELTRDVLRMDALDAEADDVEIKAALVSAVSLALKFV